MWDPEPKNKDGTRQTDDKGEPIISSLWPKRATLNTIADRVKIESISPITFKIALEALHMAAPGALAHPIISTVWQDAFSAKNSGKLEGEAGSDEAGALHSMASVLRLTSEFEEERLAQQRAGTITKLEEFLETKEESMLSSSNKKGEKFMALKCIADMKT